MRRLLVTIITVLFFAAKSMALQSQYVEMADGLRSSGKIYVVVVVIAVIFVGIILYLFSIDRRVKKMERSDLFKKQL